MSAYNYVQAMTPLGKPTNYTNPDSAGLLDPRPDDDPLNINPVLEAQSVTRQQVVNRVFGSAFAELNITNGLTYRMNFGPDYTALNDGCYNGPWTHGTCANLGANSSNQGQPPQAGDFNQEDFTYTLDNILRLNKTMTAGFTSSTSRACTAFSKIISRSDDPSTRRIPVHDAALVRTSVPERRATK